MAAAAAAAFLCLSVAAVSHPAGETGPDSPQAPVAARAVKTESGLVGGVLVAGGQVRVYKGIPYAAPPLGPLRWRPPQPAASWQGVRQATEFGPACPQSDRLPATGERIAKTSEDCLTLNIWAPASRATRRLPVMVWIHGGGFIQGAGSQPAYDGEALARRGTVVVTFNYRLGPLGFLAHPLLTKESGHNASGNYGLLDQLAVLRWVKANIRAFGGRPDRVTVFGNSAGAVSTGCLLLSPQAQGLIHAAILQSGTPYWVTRYLRDAPQGEESMEEVGELIARRLGSDRADDVLAALRSKSVDEILEASHPAPEFFGEGIRFGPVVDRWLIAERPGALLEGQLPPKMSVIVGSNGDEGSIFVAPLQGFDVDSYRRFIRTTFREHADDVLARFHVSRDADVKPTLARVLGYSAFVSPARRFARDLATLGARSYLYAFTHVRAGAAGARLGAFHGSEIPYVFGTLSRIARGAALEVDESDRALSQAMMGYWVHFAAAGDPNGEDSPSWPAYSPSSEASIEFGDDIVPRSWPWHDVSDFFDRVSANAPARKPPGPPLS